ncbi:MAG TPA: quinol:cytochrome C oxidoreductase [Bacteroides sp.]|mgnify:CR=1 FL=1|nr:quinol:cytochrome C oxidoreductase [Bacteroides sp.]
MEEKIKLSGIYITGTLLMIGVGIAAVLISFLQDPGRGWANVLLNNVYFVSLSVGALLFLSIQRVTHSGWSAGFIRVPEAMGGFLPVAALLFLLMIPGANALYHWSHAEAVARDPLLAHKAPYLNLPFWIIRMAVYFALWILMAVLLRRISLREDREGGLGPFRRGELYSRIFIFIVILTFSLAMIDWIMSIDAHWYSTIFAVKNFVAAFHHASIVIAFTVLLMNRRGYFPFLNKSHLGDFSRYIFMLCIIWGYFWFAEFMLIWYGNIPEETAYFIPRIRGEGWAFFFYANIAINWLLPFVLLMPLALARNKTVLKIVIPFLIAGQFIDLYIQIFPGTLGTQVLGFQEIGTFVGYAGLFMLVTGYMLTRANLYPVNHPFLEESRAHHT